MKLRSSALPTSSLWANLLHMLLASSFRFASRPKPVILFQIWMMLSNTFLVEDRARSERYPGTNARIGESGRHQQCW
jgi:hypothetical protein